MKNKKNGFTLLIAVVFMSVMLAFGLALGSLSYKQQVLASDAIQSQYAFYVADAALECALYADQQQNLFAYPPIDPGGSAPLMRCNNAEPVSASERYFPTEWIIETRLSLESGKRCADVRVYKPNGLGTTYIFSQGYDVSCDTVYPPNGIPTGARFVSRGLSVHY